MTSALERELRESMARRFEPTSVAMVGAADQLRSELARLGLDVSDRTVWTAASAVVGVVAASPKPQRMLQALGVLLATTPPETPPQPRERFGWARGAWDRVLAFCGLGGG